MPDTPIIDTHIHLFDTNRPQGVPWPAPDDPVLYKPALPARYAELAVPLGVTGAIVVEASPWVEDNQWVLDLTSGNALIVGMVGNLDPGAPDFRGHLERLHRNPRFLGIRYGNLWGRDLGEDLAKDGFAENLEALADAGLVLDSANPDLALLEALVRVTDQVPTLRVIVDHLPQMLPPAEERARRAYDSGLRELGGRPQVYVKISQVLRKENGSVPLDLPFYREQLDLIWDTFGPDRVLYGSDWPNSDQWGEYRHVLGLVDAFFSRKHPEDAAKYFWENSIAAYRWR